MKGAGSRGQFNQLASEYHVKLQSDEQAQKYLDWYLAVDPENLTLVKLDSAAQLKTAAERKFRRLRCDAGGHPDFYAWWQKHEREATRLRWGTHIDRKNHGLRVSFYTISDIDPKRPERGPSILRASVEFSSDGQVGRVTLKRIGAPS